MLKRALAYSTAFILLIVLVSSTTPTLLPSANAIRCQAKILKVDYPAAVDPSQSISVQTNLAVSCTTSMIDISGRVDLTDEASNTTLSIQGFHLGYVSEPVKFANYNVTNTAQAPAGSAQWKLQVVVLVFAGSQLINKAVEPVQIQVGGALGSSTNLLWVGILVVVALVVVGLVAAKRGRKKTKRR